MIKRFCNVTATVEIMVEIPEGEFITPKQFEKHLETQMWKNVSNVRVIAEHHEEISEAQDKFDREYKASLEKARTMTTESIIDTLMGREG